MKPDRFTSVGRMEKHRKSMEKKHQISQCRSAVIVMMKMKESKMKDESNASHQNQTQIFDPRSKSINRIKVSDSYIEIP